MIRHLHPTDTPALLQFKQSAGADEVFTLGQAISGGLQTFPVVKYTSIALSPRAWQGCWVKTRRARVQAVLRAGPRSGALAWELSDLFLAKNHRSVAAEVLEQVSFPAGAEGARRIFLRIPFDSDLFDVARSAGYQPTYTEHVFRAASANQILARAGTLAGGLALTPAVERDRQDLYRLYCATVPIEIRVRTGQVMDEWAASRERVGRKRKELVVSSADARHLMASVQTSDTAAGRFFSVTCRGDASCGYESLIAVGVGQAGDKPVVTLVPSYDVGQAETLEALGFALEASYDVMVKTLAVPVAKPVPGFATVGP
jgi:hypothetical protein